MDLIKLSCDRKNKHSVRLRRRCLTLLRDACSFTHFDSSSISELHDIRWCPSVLLGSASLLVLLGEQFFVDGRDDTSTADSCVGEQLVELLIVAEGELQVSGCDLFLLGFEGRVAGELEYFASEILQNCCHEGSCSCAKSLSIATLPD